MSPDPHHPDDLPELPDSHEVVAPPSPAPAVPGGQAAPDERPELRKLERAPQHLRLAAVIVVAGSVLPWMPGRVDESPRLAWLVTLLAKAVMGAAAWLWMQQVAHNWGPRLKGVLGQLAELELKPAKKPQEDDAKARRAKPKAPTTHLVHPFPTGLHALALLLAAASIYVAAQDPRIGLLGSNGPAEVAMFGWAAFTWVHIASYERRGGFNPLFPLLFLGMLFSGAVAVLGAITGEASGSVKLMAILGGGAVGVGGGLAVYTIAEAMMQAKKEGDRKKAEALETRKAARAKKAE